MTKAHNINKHKCQKPSERIDFPLPAAEHLRTMKDVFRIAHYKGLELPPRVVQLTHNAGVEVIVLVIFDVPSSGHRSAKQMKCMHTRLGDKYSMKEKATFYLGLT
jgi:hypothetical protein